MSRSSCGLNMVRWQSPWFACQTCLGTAGGVPLLAAVRFAKSRARVEKTAELSKVDGKLELESNGGSDFLDKRIFESVQAWYLFAALAGFFKNCQNIVTFGMKRIEKR